MNPSGTTISPDRSPEQGADQSADRQVSFDDEPLILVDHQDRVVGHLPKTEAHAGDGVLHRAFSVFLFNRQGEVLMQRRAAGKPLWPLVWSNSCCSHPRRGEEVEAAVHRRLHEELGIEARVLYLYKFEYQARYRDIGSEHELCWVFAARSDDEPLINPSEVADWKWLAPAAMDRELADHAPEWSPWCRMEWPRLRADHWPQIEALASPAG